MRFRLLAVYPSLPSDWEVGMVIESDKFWGYVPVSDKYSPVRVNSNEIENHPKFWRQL